ncbi:MAG: type II secretion system protein [Clostridiales bacterium]|nr:type II secretion system protein [Clostridiales bacterium]
MILFFNSTRNNKGLTLPEIIISMVTLSILAGGFLSIFSFSAKANSQSYDISKATYVAQKQMEELYYLSISKNFMDSLNQLTATSGFSHTEDPPGSGKHFLSKTDDRGFEIDVSIDKTVHENKSDKVLIKVTKQGLLGPNEAEIETILVWSLDD